MVKTKRNYVKLPKATQTEDNGDFEKSQNTLCGKKAKNYDSIIVNGPGEDSELGNDHESSDGFSEKEDNYVSKSQQSFKRKLLENSVNEIEGLKKQKTSFVLAPKNTFKQPTVDEINQLKETQNLFHSNLFRLQIDEMLNEIKLKEKYLKFVEEWLQKFTEFLESLKSSPIKEESGSISWLMKSKIHIPFGIRKLNSKTFYFQFFKPLSAPFVVGSFDIGTMIGPQFVVDICVLMPETCFQKEDYLNLIYDQKRALYLAFIAWNLSKKPLNSNCKLKFNYYRTNPHKPVLEVIPGGDIGNKLTIRIFVAPEDSSFKLSRFVPWNSNIRSNLFTEDINRTEDDLPLGTPNYNATVLFDLTMHRNQTLLTEVLGGNKNLQQGLILLKIWLRQRRLDAGYSGFSSYIMAMYVVFLFKQRKLNSMMSSYQVARNVWNLLAFTTWNEDQKGISLCSDFSSPNQPTLEQFHANYGVVFIDSTGFLNLCANLSLEVYKKVRYEAGRAVKLLNNTNFNSFRELFMTKCPVYAQFDHILSLSNDVINRVLKKYENKADQTNFAGYWYPQILKMLGSTLRKGLGDRIFSLVPIQKQTTPWDIYATLENQQKFIMFGVVLNPNKAFEVLDKGPQANDDESENFQKFWGKKSELRRFQDGSITEACVWSTAAASLAEKRLITGQIIEYLLQHHFEIENSEITYNAKELDLAYKINNKYCSDGNEDENAENTSLEVIKSFNDLMKQLRSLNSLPLDITEIQGVSPVFRYCDPNPILPLARLINDMFHSHQVCEGVIQLGLSGKWPNELSAFCALKTAFYIQISKALLEQFKIRSKALVDCIEILKKGYIFRLKIVHPKEIVLMRKHPEKSEIAQNNTTRESVDFEKNLTIVPVITSALHGLYQRYPSFGPAVMIAKRWLFSQLFDESLWPIECTELLVASLFLNPSVFFYLTQPQAVFFRFLLMLANTNWRTEMVMINFEEDIVDDTISKLETRFTTERETFPSLCIITSYDTKQSGIWTRHAPSVQVLARVQLLAKHTLDIIETTVCEEGKLIVPSTILKPNLDGYDVIINLKKSLVSNCQLFDFTTSKLKSKITRSPLLPLTDFNPVRSGLKELRDAYSEFCIFFYDPCGGTKIAIKWKPNTFSDKEFKVTSVNGREVIENNRIQCKQNTLIEDFKIILKDLFISIDIRTKF